MISVVFGFFTALILCLSFVGWGKLVALATLGTQRGGWPFQAAWGMCALTILGGLLNVTRLVSASVNISIVALGIVFWLLLSQPRTLFAGWSSLKLTPQDRFAVVILIIVSGVIVASSVVPSPWNAADDSLAYAAF